MSRIARNQRGLFLVTIFGAGLAMLPVQAQWTTQTITLQAGWNAVHLEVQPEPADCDKPTKNIEEAISHDVRVAPIAGSKTNPAPSVPIIAPVVLIAKSFPELLLLEFSISNVGNTSPMQPMGNAIIAAVLRNLRRGTSGE
jgi:hypothetical protein